MPLDQELYDEGLTLQAVINVTDCPVQLPTHAGAFRQVIVLGHGGSTFFNRTFAAQAGASGPDPLDERAIELFEAFMARLECLEFDVLYPKRPDSLDLRSLGRQLGWQSDSQLGIGIHPGWGTWFAYRLVALANTSLPVSSVEVPVDTCDSCMDKPCLTACPVSATGDEFQLGDCSTERLREGASCADRCLAREACPVGSDYRYSREQIRYHYQRSFAVLKEV